jgi:hypothetical protein
MSFCRSALIALCLWIAATSGALAQDAPPEPGSLAGGHLTVGGDVAAAFSPEDPGFFTYGSYGHSSLREFRIGLSAQLRANDRLSLLAEVRTQNLDDVSPFALYARIRPFAHRQFDIQVGRIPPTFGRASRTPYGKENPLIGQPLAYQYLTSLRADALPASAAELLSMRGRGWLANYSTGSVAASPGVPLASAFEWDTGLQASTEWKAISLAGAVTSGTISHPVVSDDNGGRQLAGRVTVRAADGLEFGGSFARGQFLSRGVLQAIGVENGSNYIQQAEGLDMELARGHWVVRAESIASEWRIPLAGRTTPLRALATSAEVKYALLPGIYAATRVEHLAFNRIAGSGTITPWDAPVTRVEIGGGYYVRRNIEARLSWQANERDGGRIRTGRLMAAQLLYWF